MRPRAPGDARTCGPGAQNRTLGAAFFHRRASAIVALATAIVGVLLACTAAYALSRHRFAGRRAGLATFPVVQMFPSVLLMMPLYVLLDRLGLLNSLLGLSC